MKPNKWLTFFKLANKKKLLLVSSPLLFILFFYLPFYNRVEFQEVGIAYDRFSGKLWLQQPGFHFTSPMTTVSVIDIRPHRVCITSTGRTMNCKLVSFNPRYYREFVSVQGHRYYWLSNRLSFNSGYSQEYRGMVDILRGWAYNEPNPPKFINIEKDF